MTQQPLPDDRALELQLRQLFEQNYRQLSSESGRSLAPDVRRAAWQQVLYYWRRLRGIALQVTDTEVKLTLGNQYTPRGRPFAIEGAADLVEHDDRTVLYDFKTHAAEQIRADLSAYAEQLHIYSYVWQQLRGRPLDHCAIISTSLSDELQQAIASHDAGRIEAALARWQPIIPVRSDQSELAAVIRRFGEVVDAIEERRFDPPSLAQLLQSRPGMRQPLVREICVNCDARHSCDAYRAYRQQAAQRPADVGLPAAPAAEPLDEPLEEIAQHDRVFAALDADVAADLLDFID
jgi:hypothetical protein